LQGLQPMDVNTSFDEQVPEEQSDSDLNHQYQNVL